MANCPPSLAGQLQSGVVAKVADPDSDFTKVDPIQTPTFVLVEVDSGVYR